MAAPSGGIQEPYMATLNLTTSENLKLYNKSIIGLTESDRDYITKSTWTGFTNNWGMLYPHLDSKQQFRLSQREMGPIYPLNSIMASHPIHP